MAQPCFHLHPAIVMIMIIGFARSVHVLSSRRIIFVFHHSFTRTKHRSFSRETCTNLCTFLLSNEKLIMYILLRFMTRVRIVRDEFWYTQNITVYNDRDSEPMARWPNFNGAQKNIEFII